MIICGEVPKTFNIYYFVRSICKYYNKGVSTDLVGKSINCSKLFSFTHCRKDSPILSDSYVDKFIAGKLKSPMKMLF